MVRPWPHPPAKLRALLTILGHHYVICHRCRVFTDITIPRGMEHWRYELCPFRCRVCGQRGALTSEVPRGFERDRA